jgi:hypothetical protein
LTGYEPFRPSHGGEVRVEEFGLQMDYSDAFEYLNSVLGVHRLDGPSASSQGPAGMSLIERPKSARCNRPIGTFMATVVNLPRTVAIALAHTLKHLATFKLTDSFTDASVFSKFADRTHMLLNSNTLTNLSAFSELSSNFRVLAHACC